MNGEGRPLAGSSTRLKPLLALAYTVRYTTIPEKA